MKPYNLLDAQTYLKIALINLITLFVQGYKERIMDLIDF